MKILKIERKQSKQPCESIEIEAPKKSPKLYPEDPYGEYEWIKIKTKPMDVLLKENDCWFDCYGNLCSKHGHVVPHHFADLGKTFHASKGCGWTLEVSAWVRY